MGQAWDEFVAGLDDAIGLRLVTLILVLAAAVVAGGWYFWPAWLPGRWWHRLRWPRLHWPRLHWARRRWRWPRRRRRVAGDRAEPAPAPESETLPDLPVEAFVSLADRLAAQGRYAEALRERLRGIVRELVDAGVVDNRPGLTVTELASTAGRTRPYLRPPVDAASALFSDVWYGQRPATGEHDMRMRGYADEVHSGLTRVPAGERR